MITLEQRIRGGIWGLLIGDALGVPYEFKSSQNIPEADGIEFIPPIGYPRSHPDVAPGTWSDDGAHALGMLASLVYCNKLDAEDLMRRLTNWYELGYFAIGGKVFDVGVQTTRALLNFRNGYPALLAGPSDVHDNGNGSLMRVLPLALWHTGSDAELVMDARTQSRITHGHLRAQLCCALYCLWARFTLHDNPNAWGRAIECLRNLYDENTPERAELEFHIRPDASDVGRGTGYVVDSLRSAVQVNLESDYESVVKTAIQLGNDTDTTACIAGGIAGLRFGVNGIPTRWREHLLESESFAELLDALVARVVATK